MDKFPALSFPAEQARPIEKELQSIVSQLYPTGPFDVPFDAANFMTVGGMTISIEPHRVNQHWYVRETPDLFLVGFSTSLFTLGGSPGQQIRVRIPEGRMSRAQQVVAGHGSDNNVFMPLRITTTTNDPWIYVFKSDISNWTLSANTSVGFQIRVRLLPVPV